MSKAAAAVPPHGLPAPTVLAFFMLCVGALVPNSMGALAVFMQRELGFDDAQLGQLLAIFWAAASVFAGAAGALTDRTGWRQAAFTGCALTAAALTLIAVSPGFVPLAFTMLLAALGYAFCSPTSNLVVVRLVHLPRQRLSFGLKQTAPIVVTMASGLAVPVIAERFGWRWVLLIGAPAILVTVLFAAVWRPRWESGDRPARTGRVPLMAKGGRVQLLMLAGAIGIGTFGMAGASGFAVRSLVEAGVAVGDAGAVLTVATLAALVVRVFGGWWLDRVTTRDELILVPLVALGATGALMMATMSPVVMSIGLVVNVCAAWSWPQVLLVKGVQRYSHAPGSASGYLQVGTSLGAACGPLTFGLVAERASFTSAWLMLVLSAGLAVAIIVRNGQPPRGTAATGGPNS